MRHRSGHGGFTLLEIAIALAVLSVLVTMAVPTLRLQAQREREIELRQSLREIRLALDAYRQAVRDGRVKLPADASGYPATLDLLVDGVPDAGRSDGARLYFLRRLPRDPMLAREATDLGIDPGWGQRSYASPPDDPRAGADVFDVYSRSAGVGLNGIPYRRW